VILIVIEYQLLDHSVYVTLDTLKTQVKFVRYAITLALNVREVHRQLVRLALGTGLFLLIKNVFVTMDTSMMVRMSIVNHAIRHVILVVDLYRTIV